MVPDLARSEELKVGLQKVLIATFASEKSMLIIHRDPGHMAVAIATLLCKFKRSYGLLSTCREYLEDMSNIIATQLVGEGERAECFIVALDDMIKMYQSNRRFTMFANRKPLQECAYEVYRAHRGTVPVHGNDGLFWQQVIEKLRRIGGITATIHEQFHRINQYYAVHISPEHLFWQLNDVSSFRESIIGINDFLSAIARNNDYPSVQSIRGKLINFLVHTIFYLHTLGRWEASLARKASMMRSPLNYAREQCYAVLAKVMNEQMMSNSSAAPISPVSESDGEF